MNIRIKKVGKQLEIKEMKIVDKNNLNVTNIWDFKEIIFEEEKLKDAFIIEFLKELFIKEKIEKISFEKVELFKAFVPIIDTVETITTLKFTSNQKLDTNIYLFIKSLKYINKIECYTMSDILLLELNKLNIEVTYRKKEFIKSDFMILNDLTTIPKMINKKKVIIYDTFKEEDLQDYKNFLQTNKNLTTIEIIGINDTNLKKILIDTLLSSKKNINVIIYQKEEEIKEIENLVKTLDKTLKKELKLANIKISIKYTNKYKEKYLLKQLNITIFRILLIILLFSTTTIYIITKIHKVNNQIEKNELENIIEEENKNLQNQEETTNNDQKEVTNNEKNEEQKKNEEVQDKVKNYEKNFKKLTEINKDFRYWLTVKNTSVSYPIVQTNDNKFYLNHSFDKSNNIFGWIFMDYRNNKNLTDQNTIIYGHDTYDTMLFGTLDKVLNKSWYTNKENQIITLENESKNIKAEIFSIYTIDVTTDYLQVVFSNKEFETFINKIKDRSIYNFNKEVTKEDKIITLSTCYKSGNKRLVIHAKIK